MPDMPTLAVEIDFAASDTSGGLVFGAGTFGTGKFAGGRGWVDVTSDMLSGSISRGLNQSSRLYATAQAGSLSVVLDNSSGDYTPTNEDSPYWNSTGSRTEIVPMRRIRVRAGSQTLWSGFVDSYDLTFPNAGKQALCTIQATDALKILNNVYVSLFGNVEKTGARIARILDAAGWDADSRDLADGTVDLSVDPINAYAWAAMQLAAESEIGGLYIAPDGSVVFRDRDALADEARSKYRQAIFGTGPTEYRLQDFVLTYDDDHIANDVRITRPNGEEQKAISFASQATYQKRTFQRTDLPLSTDAEALTYAAEVLDRLKDPQLAIESLTINPLAADGLFDAVFAREIGDRIEVHVSDDISRSVFIRGISHQWDAATWLTTFVLADASYLGDGIQVAERTLELDVSAALDMSPEGAHNTTIALATSVGLVIINARETSIALAADVALAVSVEKVAVTVGPTTGGSATSVDRFGTGKHWSNPNQAIDGSNTTSASMSVTSFFGICDTLEVKGFGFSIPSGATVVGVQFDVVMAQTGSNASRQFYAMDKGTIPGTASSFANGSLSKQTVTIGGPSDNLGLDRDAVNNSLTGIGIQVGTNNPANMTANVYEVTMTVYYTP